MPALAQKTAIRDTTFKGDGVVWREGVSQHDPRVDWDVISKALNDNETDANRLCDLAFQLALRWHPYSQERPSRLVPSPKELEMASRLNKTLISKKRATHSIEDDIKRFKAAAIVIGGINRISDPEKLSKLSRGNVEVFKSESCAMGFDTAYSHAAAALLAIASNKNTFTSTLLVLESHHMYPIDIRVAMIQNLIDREWKLTPRELSSLPHRVILKLNDMLTRKRTEYEQEHKLRPKTKPTHLEHDIAELMPRNESITIPEIEDIRNALRGRTTMC